MIVGANGAGKSTLLKIILGFVYPSSGYVSNNLLTGYVPEKVNMPPFIRVIDFLTLVNDIKKGNKEDILYYLDYWKIINAQNKKISELSKGMLQKVIITQAFLGNPELLVFDEALNGLDKEMQKKLLLLIKKEKQKGKIILITSHYQDYYKKVIDKTLLIKEGKLWEE
ncbi:MAG: ATP-binding cassette domain-containing protein [Bacilli bacterium]|nr:ATP-binding cassette domain-containing protein [Bacilli bacterium]